MAATAQPVVDEIREAEFEKAVGSMRNWLSGRASASRFERDIATPWSLALEAFEFALKIHVGRRKNGDPEMIHQIRIAHHLRTLEVHLIDAPLAIVCGMLHDIREDYGVSDEEIARRFGAAAAQKVELLTKEFMGVKKDESEYYRRLSLDPIAIVKAADRFHNHSTMGDAFSVGKQLSYLIETEDRVLPMMKACSRLFPTQSPAFENVKLSLRSQISLARPALELASRLTEKLARLTAAEGKEPEARPARAHAGERQSLGPG